MDIYHQIIVKELKRLSLTQLKSGKMEQLIPLDDRESIILIDQFLLLFNVSSKLSSDRASIVQKIINDFNDNLFYRISNFNLKYKRKIEANAFLNVFPDDIIEIYADLIEVCSDFFKVFVCLNEICNNKRKFDSIEKVSTLTDANLVSKLEAKTNNINWNFVLSGINKPIRNAIKHLRYVFDVEHQTIIFSPNGKKFFSITKFDLYKLTIRSIKVINCFIYAGYITKLYSEKDKIIELNKLLFNNLSTKELADIVSVFRSKRILCRYLKNK